MSEQDKILNAIKKKFPGHAKLVDQLYEQNEDFQMLCRDYLSCIESLYKYELTSNEQKQNLKDYKNIISELEKELSEFIRP